MARPPAAPDEASVRLAVITPWVWSLDVVAIGRRLREEAPDLVPLFLQIVTIPDHWLEIPDSESDFIEMLEHIHALQTKGVRTRRRREAVAAVRLQDALSRGAA